MQPGEEGAVVFDLLMMFACALAIVLYPVEVALWAWGTVRSERGSKRLQT